MWLEYCINIALLFIYYNTFILIVDINECNLNIDDCHQFATCSNTPGSFECRCNVGHEGDGVNCGGIHCLIKSFGRELFLYLRYSLFVNRFSLA